MRVFFEDQNLHQLEGTGKKELVLSGDSRKVLVTQQLESLLDKKVQNRRESLA